MSNIENKGMEKPNGKLVEKNPLQFVEMEKERLKSEGEETPEQSRLEKATQMITKFVAEKTAAQTAQQE